MKTLITSIVLIIGIGLFFLVTGFAERSSLLDDQVKMRKEELHDTLNTRYNKLMPKLSFIPDITVQLATGEYIQLPKLIDRKKYIFINVWSGTKMIDRLDLRMFDSIAETYKNKLMVIGLLDDGSLVRLNKLITKYQLKNLQGVVSTDIKKYLKPNEYPCGILFSKTGKLIEAGMNGDALGTYMKKHVSASRAKF
jgi:hypothetical protein